MVSDATIEPSKKNYELKPRHDASGDAELLEKTNQHQAAEVKA